jgi:hypothetical protein
MDSTGVRAASASVSAIGMPSTNVERLTHRERDADRLTRGAIKHESQPSRRTP